MNYHLIDNGLIRWILKKGNIEVYNTFYNELKIRGYINNSSSKIMATPFSAMEVLGITIPDLKPDTFLPTNFLDEYNKSTNKFKYIHDVANGIKWKYHNSIRRYLKRNEVITAYKEQLKYTEPYLKVMFANTFKFVKRSSFMGELYDAYAFDRLTKHEFPKNVRKYFYLYYLWQTLIHDVDVSIFRAIRLIVQDLVEEESKKEPDSPVSALLIKTLGQTKLKAQEDYLDTELLHLMTIGTRINRTHYQVCGFIRGDSQRKQIIEGVRLYKSLLKYFIQEVERTERMNDLTQIIQTFKSGILFFVKDDGTVFDEIDFNKLKYID